VYFNLYSYLLFFVYVIFQILVCSQANAEHSGEEAGSWDPPVVPGVEARSEQKKLQETITLQNMVAANDNNDSDSHRF
jgi:hypothetical protein